MFAAIIPPGLPVLGFEFCRAVFQAMRDASIRQPGNVPRGLKGGRQTVKVTPDNPLHLPLSKTSQYNTGFFITGGK
jgi:hypothetical protein